MKNNNILKKVYKSEDDMDNINNTLFPNQLSKLYDINTIVISVEDQIDEWERDIVNMFYNKLCDIIITGKDYFIYQEMFKLQEYYNYIKNEINENPPECLKKNNKKVLEDTFIEKMDELIKVQKSKYKNAFILSYYFNEFKLLSK